MEVCPREQLVVGDFAFKPLGCFQRHRLQHDFVVAGLGELEKPIAMLIDGAQPVVLAIDELLHKYK